MTAPIRQRDRGDGRPRCFDGDPPSEYVANAGFDEVGRLQTTTIPWAFSAECKSWAGHPGSDPVPMIEGWACAGCRHYPSDLVAAAIVARDRRNGGA